MNRNTQERFALNPTNIDIQRSRFLMTPEVKLSFNVGDLIPIGMPIEVLPGDTFEIDTAFAVRMQPLVSSPMDNLSFDYYWFFVPNRIVWTHWKEFMGENNDSAWIPQVEYTVPQLKFTDGGVPKSIADYMGLPTAEQLGGENHHFINVSALPFRGFAAIYDQWFRNQNLVPPLHIDYDDTNRSGANRSDGNYSTVQTSVARGGILPKVSKRPDYFTKALPGPQKGPDLALAEAMPVYFGVGRELNTVLSEHSPKHDIRAYKLAYPPTGGTANSYGLETGMLFYDHQWADEDEVSGISLDPHYATQPTNWFVDSGLTVSALRTAFQVQKLYEKDARGGTRYREMLKSHFGVTSPDASQQVPQYLGGKNVPININSVIQTSETGSTPQGNIAGYSLTSHGSRGHDFIQSFTEHGYLFCVGCARIDQHTYQNGIHRSWNRKSRLDYYFPVLANISEQPILNQEIFAEGYTLGDNNEEVYVHDKEVFGYQEAWAEYRYMPSICAAEMKSLSTNSLDSWHFADDYDQLPSLSESWIAEDKSNVDRTLAVQSSVADQLFGDFRFNIKATRPIPLYSIPGLIDHH